jgi:hypothetical protein
MKQIHCPTILVTLGLVGLVALLSAQNPVGAHRSVQVSNPLGVPGWVPSGVWMARRGYDPSTGTNTYQDYTVPTGHFALIRTISGRGDTSSVSIDEGAGFFDLATMGYGGGDLDPGIVVDEGVIIRAQTVNQPVTVHGYLIPK